jgi:crotonobetainyl-CoA:carnitine CoA-transferase CaiB-like acyl-CoA transferase
MKAKLLEGIRVLDFSRILVGAYSSMMLADLGAEVIKIEPPGGDETRAWGPPFRGKDSVYYLSINRNKKSLCMNLKEPEAQYIAKQLIKHSDILIENFVYGKMNEFNLGYNSVKDLNNKLIYTTVNSFGNNGPMREKPGFDLIIQAFTGLMNITGDKHTDPYKVGYPMCDIMTAAHVYSAILAALLYRSQTGEGQYINTSLLEANMFSMPTIVAAYLNAGINAKRRGNDHPNISPYTVFKMKDSEFISIGVATDFQFKKLWNILNLKEDYECFSSNKLRIENRDKLKALIQTAFETFEPNELMQQFSNGGIPFSKINSMKDLFGDYPSYNYMNEQISELDLVKTVRTEDYGELNYIRNPVTYSKVELEEFSSPPTLGRDNDYVLKDILGMTSEKILSLKNKKVILENLI